MGLFVCLLGQMFFFLGGFLFPVLVHLFLELYFIFCHIISLILTG